MVEQNDQLILWPEFESYLVKQRLRSNTAKKYTYQARKFFDSGILTEPDEKVLFDKITEFITRGNRAHSMFAIKHLLYYLNKKRVWKRYFRRIGRTIKQKPRLIQNKFLKIDDILRIRDQLIEPYKTLFMVQYEGALRISEVLGIKKGDIKKDDQGRLLLSITMKGGSKATVTLINRTTVQALREHYNKTIGLIIFDVCINTVNIHYKRAAEAVMIDGKLVSSHWIRHSRAVDVWNRTKDVMVIKLLLRHKRLETTFEYLRSSGLLESKVMEDNPISWESPQPKQPYGIQGEPESVSHIISSHETKAEAFVETPETPTLTNPTEEPKEHPKKRKDIFDE